MSDANIAYLVGVTENEGERHCCSLVFTLKTDSGLEISLRQADLLEALRFVQNENAMPALSPGWWARARQP